MTPRLLAVLLGLGLLAFPGAHTVWAQDGEDPEIEVETDETDGEQLDVEVMTEEELEEIGTTVQDIERMIQLPPPAQLGQEADEDLENPRSIFRDKAVREALLGPEPDHVYIPSGIDPMIIPWVRERIVVEEKLKEARDLFDKAQKQITSRDKTEEMHREAQRTAERAQTILEELQENYPEATQANQVEQLSRSVQQVLAMKYTDEGTFDPTRAPEIEERVVELPPWVIENTDGILLDRDDPRESLVLLDDQLLRPGDRLKRYSAITVKEVLPQQVIYDYQGSEFIVKVDAYDPQNQRRRR